MKSAHVNRVFARSKCENCQTIPHISTLKLQGFSMQPENPVIPWSKYAELSDNCAHFDRVNTGSKCANYPCAELSGQIHKNGICNSPLCGIVRQFRTFRFENKVEVASDGLPCPPFRQGKYKVEMCHSPLCGIVRQFRTFRFEKKVEEILASDGLSVNSFRHGKYKVDMCNPLLYDGLSCQLISTG